MTNHYVPDGQRFVSLANKTNKMLYLTIRISSMIYDKGHFLLSGNLNGYTFLGMIVYDKYGSVVLTKIWSGGGTIPKLTVGKLVDNNTAIQICVQFPLHSSILLECTDRFEYGLADS